MATHATSSDFNADRPVKSDLILIPGRPLGQCPPEAAVRPATHQHGTSKRSAIYAAEIPIHSGVISGFPSLTLFVQEKNHHKMVG
jgi:hypothetical protein